MDQSVRILVVDDEKRAVELLSRTLRKTGKVDCALSGEEGIEKLEANYYDLVISDQRMPGLNGVEVLSFAAERNESCGRILLTGYSDLDATVAAINRGRVHAYLHKPCAPNDLLMVVDNVLARSRLTQENIRLESMVSEQSQELQASTQDRLASAERLAALGKMINTLVLDLRAPISAVHASASETVREGEQHKLEEVIGLGREIAGEAESMRLLCDELLAMVSSTDGAVRLQETSLDEALEAAIEPLRGDAATLGVRIESALAADCRVQLDPDRFGRAIANLLRNALEAAPEGGRVHVESRVSEGMASLTVSDDGPGVPPEIACVVFEPFTTAGKEGGIGLGLAIARKIVEDHGGSVALRDSDTGGAAFEVRVPVATRQ